MHPNWDKFMHVSCSLQVNSFYSHANSMHLHFFSFEGIFSQINTILTELHSWITKHIHRSQFFTIHIYISYLSKRKSYLYFPILSLSLSYIQCHNNLTFYPTTPLTKITSQHCWHIKSDSTISEVFWISGNGKTLVFSNQMPEALPCSSKQGFKILCI